MSSPYTEYYLNQAGLGDGTGYFHGGRVQRGYGIGGFFAKLWRSAVPFILPGLKIAGRELAKTGLAVASDVMNGAPIKDSAHSHFHQTGRELASRGIDHLKEQLGGGELGYRVFPTTVAPTKRRRRRRKTSTLRSTSRRSKPKTKRKPKKKSSKQRKNVLNSSPDIFRFRH